MRCVAAAAVAAVVALLVFVVSSTPGAAQLHSPDAAYAFSEGIGGTTADLTGNGNTATLVNGAGWTSAGRFGAAMALDGVNDGVQLPVTPSLALGSTFTIEAWVRPTAMPGAAQQIVQVPGVSGDGLRLSADGRPRFVAAFSAVTRDVTGPSPLPVNDWSHVGLTYDGAMLRLYVNGAEVATGPASGGLSGNPEMRIGRARGGGNPFGGQIDEALIYRRALTAGELWLDAFTPVDPATPFQVSTVTPSPQAGAVIATPVAVTFSRSVNAATVTSSTVLLHDAGHVPVPASVTYNAATRTATLSPSESLSQLAAYTAGVLGGEAGVLDETGVPLAADEEWTFTTAAPDTTPSAAYGFSEGSGLVALDSSGNGHTGALVSGPSWATGQFGGALLFDGVDDGVEVTVTDALRLASAFTLEAWVQPLSSSTALQILQLAGPSGDGLRVTSNGRPRFTATFPGGVIDVTGPASLPLFAWTHVAVSYNGTILRLYVDGIAVATQPASGALAGALPLWIGRTRGGGSPFKGTLDEIRIWRRALNASEILLNRNTPIDAATAFQVSSIAPTAGAVGVIGTAITATFSRAVDEMTLGPSTFALMDAGQTTVPASVEYDTVSRTAMLVPAAPLVTGATYTAQVRGGSGGVLDAGGAALSADVVWSLTTARDETLPSAAYALDEGAGTQVADASGNGHTGVLLDGPVWTSSGQYAGALLFDGVDDGVRLPPSDALTFTAAVTLEAWVQPLTQAGAARQIVQLPGAGGDGLRLTANGSPRFRALFPNGRVNVTGPTPLAANVWTHVAATYDGTMLRMYVNGGEVATQPVTGDLTGAFVMSVGRTRLGGAPFQGALDEIRIYRRALTAAEIAGDMNTPIGSSSQQPVSLAVTPVGASIATGATYQFTATATYADDSTSDLTASVMWSSSNAAVATVNGGLAGGTGAGLATLTATLGSLMASAQIQVADGTPLPPDPSWVAPPVNPTGATLVHESTRFLYTGPEPIQTDVAPDAIDPRRAAVVRGQVTTRDGAPLAGATVTVAEHPEYGSTLSRGDGGFDLAVNGGTTVLVRYEKVGYLPADRHVDVPRGEYAVAADAALVPLDAQVTTVDLSGAAPTQVARGSTVTDASGTRRATLAIPAGTTASMTLPNGTTQPVTTLHLRATEYTVGPGGRQAMPASLPATSAYTYAVELSADEALDADASSVDFSTPLPLYVENFLGFPVGTTVPSGYYDRVQHAWVPSRNGVVLKVLAPDGLGRAEIDLTGDDVAEDPATLSLVGLTDSERTTLSTSYSAGQTLWRVLIPHFSPWDLNWSIVGPGTADPSPNPPPPQGDVKASKECKVPGFSIIGCQNQVLGERLPIAGTPFALNYSSDRVPGRLAALAARIPLTEETLPTGVIRIEVEVTVAGRRFTQTFAPVAGAVYDFEWDGRDAYGRLAEGEQRVDVAIQHVYEATYSTTPLALILAQQNTNRLFGVPGLVPLGVPGRAEYHAFARSSIRLGTVPRLGTSAAGWSLDPHHIYDPVSQTLYLGDGRQRSVVPLDRVVRVSGPSGFVFGMTVGDDNALHFIQFDDSAGTFAHRALTTGGTVITVDGDLPQLIGDIVIDRNGTLYYTVFTAGNPEVCAGTSTLDLHRRSTGGTDTVLGTASVPLNEDCSAMFFSGALTRAGDGTFFVALGRSVFQLLAPGAPMQRIAIVGTGPYQITALAAGPSGMLLAATIDARIYRVLPDGSSAPFAGFGSSGDGGLALEASISGIVSHLKITPDGSVLVPEAALRLITPDGLITTIAGSKPATSLPVPDGSPASALSVGEVAIGGNGEIFAAAVNFVYRLRQAYDGDAGVAWRVASEDGSEVYEFDEGGRLLRTRHALTGATLANFTYSSEGWLTELADGDGQLTRIERSGDGRPTALVAPFGQRTVLEVDPDGWLARVMGPGGVQTTLTSTPEGLLTHLTDANGHPHTFTYDTVGRLQQDDDPSGGSQTLIRTGATQAWTVTRTSELGRAWRYDTTVLPSGAQSLILTSPDAMVSTVTRNPDGSQFTIRPDGTVTSTVVAGDPRFGLQSPVAASVTVSTPGGLTFDSSTSRTAIFGSTQDLSTLQTQTDTTVVNGRPYETVFNAATRTFTSSSPAGRSSSSSIDAQGRVTRTQVGSLTPVDFTYDSQGRLTSIAQGARQSTVAYDGAGRPAALTDALTRTVTFGYDAADRVTRQTLPDTRQIGFGYDPNSNVTSLTPPGRPAHTFTYTPVDLTASYMPPAVPGAGSTGYTFNVDRQPTAIARPGGQTTGFGYDGGGRLSTVTFSRGALQYTYDTAGRVSTLTDPGGVALTFTYDGPLPISETWSGPVAGVVTRTFSNDFDVAAENVNDASEIAFGYDADRLLTQAGDLTVDRDTATGLVTGTTLATTTEAFTYNPFGESTRQTAQVGGANVFDVQITRDDLGRITQRIETVDGITRVFEYGYDLAGRLWQVGRNGTLVARYLYDANGNRIDVQGELGPVTATYDDQDRLLTYNGATYTYTANGELATRTVGGATTSYVYDTLGNLTQVTKPNGDVITYTVDGRGRRVGKSVNGVRVKGWLYADQLRPIAELDGNGDIVSRFVYGSRVNVPEYVIKNGETYRIFSDHLGSPRVVVHATTGVIVQRMDFQAFGEIIQDSNPGWQPFGFAGGLYDADTGLVRFGARDYDVVTGKWTVKDPILFGGGQANLYSYVDGDPLNFIDPTGLRCGSFGQRWLDSFRKTNEWIPGVLAPALLPGLGFGTASAGKVAEIFGSPTFLQWARVGFRGVVMGAAEFTAIETGIVVGAVSVVNFALIGTVFEVGVGIGSAIDAAWVQESCPDAACEGASP